MKIKKIVICLLGLTISLGYIKNDNLIVNANEIPLENSNVNALISAFEYVNKEAYVDRYNNTTAYIHTIDGYNNKQEIEFDYIKNQVKSIKEISEIMLLSEDEEINNGDSYTYNEDGLLTSITTPSTSYTYNYNENGVLLSQGINGNNIIMNNYNNDEMLMSKNYINGTTKQYLYNTNNKISSIKVNDVTYAEYIYTNDLLTQYKDLRTNITYNYLYNEDNKVVSMNSSNGINVSYVYDENNETIIRRNYTFNGFSFISGVEDEGLRTAYSEVTERRDISDRIKEYKLRTEFNCPIITYFDYVIDEPYYEELTEENHDEKMENATTDMKVEKLSNYLYDYEYEYDENNNIIYKYINDNLDGIYNYDSRGFLRHSNNIGINNNEYTYDSYGNIITKEDMNYKYENRNGIYLLRQAGPYTFNYDNMGNPIKYKNIPLLWEGRELKKYGSNISYTYDMSGVRSSKTVNGITTTYVTEGDKVIFEKIPNKNLISYIYMKNEIIGLVYDNTPFYYLKNAQKDIISIVDGWGEEVVTYKYDPWGKILSIDGVLKDSLGVDNPYRYRSYRYDNETNLYYLVSRYYDPELGRFINQDDTMNLQYTILDTSYSKNLYMYAKNNPMTYYDPLGNMPIDILVKLNTIYSQLRLINDQWLSYLTINLNLSNLYQSFHETAQLVASKELSKRGFKTKLEYKIGSKRADIYAKKNGVEYLYEVKPITISNSTALSQLKGYLSSTGFIAGNKITNYDGTSIFSIDFLPNIELKVQFFDNGIIKYHFIKEKKVFFNKMVAYEIEEYELVDALKRQLYIALAISGAIVIATLVEDIITAGAGVADDVASLGVASYTFRKIISLGLYALV